MNIKIITTEKMAKGFIKKGIKEYSKRLSRYCKIKHVYIKKVEDIKKNIKDKTYIIRVDREGEMISSEGLSGHLKNLGIEGKSDIVFLITQEEIPELQVDMHLALTSMEMEYELMILTLYEQVYRAFTIIHNLPYHK